jgi:hypothetical protein
MYRALKMGDLSYVTTLINAIAVTWFTFITIVSRCKLSITVFVCPSLIALVFYYMTWLDYDTVDVSIFYKTVIGITICFFLLVVFNEVYIITTIVYTPFLIYFMYKCGKDMLGEQAGTGELVARCLFMCFIFGVVAYKME